VHVARALRERRQVGEDVVLGSSGLSTHIHGGPQIVELARAAFLWPTR
jgi:hypothetical protein